MTTENTTPQNTTSEEATLEKFTSTNNLQNDQLNNDEFPIEPQVPEPDYHPTYPEVPEPEFPRRRSGRRSQLENLKEVGQLNLPPAKSQIQCLSIIGQIEGHLVLPPQNKTTKYEHIIPQLVAIEQSPEVKGVLIILNTVGGDVEAGLAIAEMLVSMSKPTVSLVLGGGHSIGVPIAVASDYSFIAETATMTIHPIRLTGLVIGVPQTYEYMDKMQDRVVRFVTAHSQVTEKKFRELMFRTGELARDIGTVLVGKEAVNIGMIDEVGGLGPAVAKINQMVQQKDELSRSHSGMGTSTEAKAQTPDQVLAEKTIQVETKSASAITPKVENKSKEKANKDKVKTKVNTSGRKAAKPKGGQLQ